MEQRHAQEVKAVEYNGTEIYIVHEKKCQYFQQTKFNLFTPAFFYSSVDYSYLDFTCQYEVFVSFRYTL